MDQVRLRLGTWVSPRVRDGRLELLHDVALRFGLGSRADAVADLLTQADGFTQDDLAALVGPTNAEAVVGRLVEQRMARPWSGEAPQVPRHLLHQSGYLDAVADDPVAAQTALTDARVTIVGVGGIGALVLQHLLGAGVRPFRLVDGDAVDESNLNRQYLFAPGDVGRRKVDVARDYAEAFAGSDVTTSYAFITDERGLDDLPLDDAAAGGSAPFEPTFVVCAADQPAGLIEQWCADHAARHGAGLVTSGVGIHRGHWGPVVQPGLTPCHACAAEPRSPGPGPGPLPVSFGPVNSMVAAGVAAHAAWSITRSRTAADLARTTVIDVHEPFLRVLPARDRRPDCDAPHCRPRDKD